MPLEQESSLADLSNLTHSQVLIWTGQLLAPDDPLYNMVLAFRIGGAVDPVVFQQAFQRLVDDCDVLRTVITTEKGVPQQRVLPEFAYAVPLIDFSQDAAPEQRYAEWLARSKQRTFDLSRCHFDTALVKLGDDDFVWYLNQHHVLTDAWSVSVLYRKMQHYYGLARQGRLDQAEPLPAYQDYVAQDRRDRRSDRYAKAQAFWSEKLKTPVPPSSFYRRRGSTRSGRTVRIPCRLGAERTRRVRALTGDRAFQAFTPDLALFQIFATVLFAYLHRLSGQRAVSIGAPAHNRTTAEQQESAGLFIEVFPLSAEIGEADSFADLYRTVSADARHFLLNAVPGTGGAETNRAFDVILNYITARFGDFDGLPMRSEWVHADHGDANHLLRLQVQDFDQTEDLELYFDLNEAVFVNAERQWVGDHFLRLLDALLDDPDTEIASVPLLSDDEFGRFESEVNASPDVPPEGETVIQMFEAQVAKTPQATALRCEDAALTYQDLNARANRVAHDLSGRGIGPGNTAAISMMRSVDMVVAIFGVLKSGAAYVPVDPGYPADRVAYLLENSGADLIIVDDHAAGMIPAIDVPVAKLADLGDVGDAAATGNPPNRAGSDDTAYVMYTSGSTGRPKGVAIGHDGLANYVSWCKRFYLRGDVLDFPLFTSFSFDLTVTSLYVPLVSGGTLVVYPEHPDRRDVDVQKVVEDNAVDIVKLTPAHLSVVQNTDFSTSRIRALIVGGEDFKSDLARIINRRFGGDVEIYNEYGPTEATVACAIHRFDRDDDTGSSVPIGRSIDNLQAYVLDAARHPVPQGVTGEIHIGGAGVAKGYVNNADETAERFVANPFRPGQRLYKTGDLGRWNPDGRLDYLGRADTQVKIRGIRMELTEIEGAILTHPDVSETAAAVFEQRQSPLRAEEQDYCVRCGLSGNHPSAQLDGDCLCRLCRVFESQRDLAMDYFGTMNELRSIAQDVKASAQGPHDCIMLLSGGKDSTYALCQLVDLGLKPLVFFLDNGFISDGAKANIRRIVDQLGLDLHVGSTPAMNDIFVDSLKRFSDVCDGCFKTIYTLSMNLAREKGIRYIFTGLSRGQIFDTRVADFFNQRIFDPDEIDRMVIEARKAYHRMDDVPCRKLDVAMFKDDAVFEEIRFVDFYRYSDVSLEGIFDYLDTKVPWIRPLDTGRSTNCLINKAGIHVHTNERRFHNYSSPYSWDVRLGHKKRDEALAELQDDIAPAEVYDILQTIGYRSEIAAAEDKRLVAYYVSPVRLPAGELERHLAAKLPSEFVPKDFVRLDSLPLTANGKVDRRALPEPDDGTGERPGTFIAPGTETEKALARIWRQVLGLDDIGIHDDFFALGGDSIHGIQIVNQARRVGLTINPQQIFDHPTIAELAAAAGSVAVRQAEQGAVTGLVALTPAQRRFFDQHGPDPEPYSQAVLLEIEDGLDIATLENAIREVLVHHDGLRCSFSRTELGWHGVLHDIDTAAIAIDWVDLIGTPPDGIRAAIDRHARSVHKTLDIGAAPLFRACRFSTPEGGPDLLLFIVHHLVIDGLSWRIMLEDLETACEQLIAGRRVRLPAKTASQKDWTEALQDYAFSDELREETAYWTNTTDVNAALPGQLPPGTVDRHVEASTVSAALTRDETRQLIHDLPQALDIRLPEVLATALAQSFADWAGRDGILADFEGHGREAIADGLDLLRSVGWFTSVYPVGLQLGHCTGSVAAMNAVKRQFRSVPNRGIGYGVLRYLAGDNGARTALEQRPQADLLFNFLGHWDKTISAESRFRFTGPVYVYWGDDSRRAYALEANAAVFDGAFVIDWTFNERRHARAEIERFSDTYMHHLRRLIADGVRGSAEDRAEPDFSHADLDEQGMADVLAEFGQDAD